MSRIGKKPVAIPAGVKVSVKDGIVTAEGKEKLTMVLPRLVDVEISDTEVVVKQQKDTLESSAMQGLTRALIQNMVIGLSTGFKKELQIVGVGYKAQVQGSKLVLNLGYSHTIEYQIPKGLTIAMGEGKTDEAAAHHGLECLAKMPIDPALASLVEREVDHGAAAAGGC